jgi:uncharacterized protein
MKPQFKIIFEGTDISAEVDAVSYSDGVGDQSDTSQFKVFGERWVDNWQPKKGDKFTLEFGYLGQIAPAGTFFVDQFETSGPPDVHVIKGLAVPLNSDLRTKKSKAYEKVSLATIAQEIAGRAGLKLSGITRNVIVERTTQNRQSDLSFLLQVARKYGYVFTIKGNQLVFTDVFTLEKKTPVLELAKTNLSTWSFTDQVSQVYAGAENRYFPNTKGAEVTATQTGDQESGADVLQIRERTENEALAGDVVKARLHEKNKTRVTTRFSMVGNPFLAAGIVVKISGFGVFSGNYFLENVAHALEVGTGYKTDVEARKV